MSIVGCSEIMNDYSRILKSSSLSVTGDKNFENNDNIRLISAESNGEAVKQCSEVEMEHALNLCHLKLDGDQVSEENLAKTVNAVDDWVKTIWTNAALHGLVCVIFGEVNSTSSGACFLNIKRNSDMKMHQTLS